MLYELTYLSKLELVFQVLRKKYYNMVEDMKGKIRVYCRSRPLSSDEIKRVGFFNLFKLNGISHSYQLGQFILRVVGWYFSFLFKLK